MLTVIMQDLASKYARAKVMLREQIDSNQVSARPRAAVMLC
jgi:hypothetical protein